MEIKIPFENKSPRGNYFGHKRCYVCHQVYDARFSLCINCGSDVWGNANINIDKAIEQATQNTLKSVRDKIESIFSEGWFMYFQTTYGTDDMNLNEQMILAIDKKIKELLKTLGGDN